MNFQYWKLYDHTIIILLVIVFNRTVVGHEQAYPSHGLNITEDLFGDTLSPSNQSPLFNLTDWFCLDYFLSNRDNFITHKYDFTHCHCFLNVYCPPQSPLVKNQNQNSKNGASLEESKDHLDNSLFWFRCYDLQQQAVGTNLFVKFAQSLPRNLIRFAGREPSKCLPTELGSDGGFVRLRADFIRCEKSDIFEFIQQTDEKKLYELDSLTIRESDLDDIPVWLFRKFNNLKYLNLTNNKLRRFDSGTSLHHVDSSQKGRLTTIDLSKNRLTHVDLSRLVSLRSINLFQNNLTSLSRNDFSEEVINLLENMKANNERALLDLSIGNNPWNCNQDIEWLIDLISDIVKTNGRLYFYEPNGNNNQHHLELFQTNEPECDRPSEAKMFPFSVWKSVKESPICGQCNCYLNDKYAKVGYRYVIVNCTNRNLKSLPIKLPKNTKILDLSNNHIRNLSPLTKAHGQLNEWRHVNKIILSNNSLETLDGLDSIRSIVFLDISGNLLTEIPYHIINKVLSSKIDKFRIGNNPYVCDCNTVKMQKWLQNNYRIILDIKQVRCGYLRQGLAQNESYSEMIEQAMDSKFYHKEILHINSLHLCPSGYSRFDALDIINIILAVSILFLIIKVTYDFCWQKRTGKLPRFFKLNI